jgi:ferric-dicitrate binding protein FerR (iron transport regulator)
MEQFDQNLLHKYRQNECSPEEYAKVLEWFTSEEGKEYLETAMSHDLERGVYDPVTSTGLYQRILDTTQPRKNRFMALKVAAMLTGTLLLGYGGWKLFSPAGNTIIHTAYGEIRTVVLPDQSVVTLNANSTLRYNNRENREVWMEGEAYFSVKPSVTSKPFLVHTASKINVEVLGTTFNLVDRHGRMQIVLTSGKVRLHNNNEATIMKPGDLVEYKKQVRTTLKQHTDTINYSSWKNNSLHFENASFAELSQLLEDTYGVTVEIRDSSLLQQQFTGTVPGQKIDILLNGLSQLFHLKVTNENNKVIIEKDSKY